MPRKLLAAAVSGALLSAAPATSAHGPGQRGERPAAAPRGSAEAQLRQVETSQLGAEHARAHAVQRDLAQRELAVERGDPARAARARAAAAAPRATVQEGGQWSPSRPLPVIAINAAVVPTGPAAGKVLMFAYPNRPRFQGLPNLDLARAYLWDPTNGTSEQVDPPIDPRTGQPTNIWCGGISFLADGRILVTGGNIGDATTQFFGINTVFTFDPAKVGSPQNPWQRHPPMRQGRWYPTQLLMPDGRSLIVGGNTRPADPSAPDSPPPGQANDPDFRPGGSGEVRNSDVEIFSPDGSLERDDLQLAQSQTASAPGLTGIYPHMFWMPSGRALVAGPQRRDSWYADPGATGQATTWTDVPDLARERNWGTSVLVGDKVWMLGGSPAPPAVDPSLPAYQDQPATATTEVFDDANPAAGWVSGPAMAVARSHANSVLLPDGRIATIGGGYGNRFSELYRWTFTDAQKQVELFDPATGASQLGNPQAEGRTYHSTALLLPDATVLSAGDDINGPVAANDPGTPWDETRGEGTGAASDTAEIYRPPYLFDADGTAAARPVIAGAPQAIRVGSAFRVSAGGPPVARGVLVAPGAATHAVDSNQRRIDLGPPQPGPGGTLIFQAPDADRAPPGHYMLFLMSTDGVPSVARFVRLGLTAPDEPGGGGGGGAGGGGGGGGGGAGGPGGGPGEQPRTAKPRLVVSGRLPALKTLRRAGRFKLAVEVNQAGRVSVLPQLETRIGVKVRVKTGGRTRTVTRTRLKLSDIAVRRSLRFTAAGRRSVTFTLSRSGRRLLGRRTRAVVRVRAKGLFDSGLPLGVQIIRRNLR